MLQPYNYNWRLAALVDLLGDVQNQQPRPMLNLPNLFVKKPPPVKFLFMKTGVKAYAKIVNNGNRDSGPFTVLTTTTQTKTPNQNVFDTVVKIADLPAMTEQEILVSETVFMPGLGFESIVVSIWVDPPTLDRPSGQVYESNEEDNFAYDGIIFPPMFSPM